MTEKKAAQAVAAGRSPFDLFETDPELERGGVKVDYDGFWFQLARAGGANEAFSKRLSELTAPYQRAIDTNAISPKLAQKLTRQAFCETILLGWGSEVHGDGNMIARDRSALPFTLDNAQAFFEQLPDLMADLLETARKGTVYRRLVVEDAAKN